MLGNEKNFLILNAIIITLVVLYLVWRRPGSKTRLKLSSRSEKSLAKTSDVGRSLSRPEVMDMATDPQGEKFLNVIFNYNGHDWDAFEVLGLPAGSSKERVDRAYKDALQKVDEPSKAFIHSAYRAIVSKQF